MDIGIANLQALGGARAASSHAAPAPTAKVSAEPAVSVSGVTGDQESSQPVEEAVTSMQTLAQNISRNLAFSMDDSSGRVVVTVTDKSSGEVIRQLPSEEALRLAESLDELRSLMFKAEA